ncbi:Uncharacterised protein [Serratia quinivorans]|uniref:hypothetical protein n=1 Tax=Serratia TaxID=613 RepID=UPI001F4BF1A3|nr:MULTISPECIES: hypothetical protein [Serratia]ULG13824.1 hypothetical protein 12ap_00140 [Serratia proteamaculans]ULG13966.1 hypothetical protein 12dp_00140 [Serratia proteamaculans]ULG14945.1 hypothetical protein 149p1_00116 [Serratia proteamaculans]ULG15408.1 hypothetical protein 336p_00139 [Serratia proteamaculans]ULG15576.1 hypothetical protein 465p1_00173 [Serratia proteamaculans]
MTLTKIGHLLACTGYILWYCGKFRLAYSALGLSFLTVIVIFARGEGVFERGDTGIYSAYIAALLIMVGGVLLKVFDKPRMGLSVLLIALGVAIGGWFY